MNEKLISRMSSLVFVFAIFLFYGCNYYKPVTKNLSASPETKVDQIDSLSQKTFILHIENRVFLMRNTYINKEKQKLEATLEEVPMIHQTYLMDDTGKFKYDPKSPNVLHEVHVYANLDEKKRLGDQVVIPVQNINRIELIERDKQRSSGNTVLAVVGITVGTLAVISAIVALTKSSCPFVSVHDGENYALQGETFGGAIYPSLAREDFVPLPAAAIGREIKVQISNELKERQYTDMADLILVEHNSGDQILVSPDGQLYLAKQNIKPISATLNGRSDMLDQVSATDNIPCSFNDLSHASSVNELVLNFDNPGEKKKLVLQVDMRNSMWLDFLMAEFTSNFGSRYVSWVEEQKKRPAQDFIDWQENQNMPLTVAVKTKDGWKLVEKVKTIGPLMNREVAISLEGFDLGSEPIEISLITGFMFWEIDRISLTEVSPVAESAIQVLKPYKARDEKDRDILSPIIEKDGIYLEQLQIGNRAYLTYQVNDFSKEKEYSAFFYTKGYYEPIREFEGPTNKKFLTKFREPGAFPDFSKYKYQEVTQSAYLVAK
ncbi:hypothetical protein [Aquiflexum gelatinilyticum]|uniref:Uncharacterized protein n=1 Tax=Aquiflexum gelatinilyticum TaxID=2961943 RepID=A0A9X2T1K4_9BACT|nr:hypothetical protein [Aquiflexum gelatinilyticum]MCR9016818.1 hypothetical protein [Aquiflexum gelatinilyticum]MCS4434253.1 hypothetical protein [Aquiflexum gelatinilyticum]